MAANYLHGVETIEVENGARPVKTVKTPDVPRIPSPEIMAAGYSGRGATATGGGASGGIKVSFNPQFFLNGKETAAPAGLTGALNMSLHELEKMLERLLAQKQRKEYS
ncbi:hypothetical protein E0V32_21720 [Salmonella enterica subsp. enterica serovar Typhi]|nr:hypothetical protein [Salmonella enterica subsp. enterica serovar Typhi]EDJ8977669.1 hypothetical protein [Salmonella enterica subsp. enterica serovar Typhi]